MEERSRGQQRLLSTATSSRVLQWSKSEQSYGYVTIDNDLI